MNFHLFQFCMHLVEEIKYIIYNYGENLEHVGACSMNSSVYINSVNEYTIHLVEA